MHQIFIKFSFFKQHSIDLIKKYIQNTLVFLNRFVLNIGKNLFTYAFYKTRPLKGAYDNLLE
jgi:hypothetical protein